MSDFQRDEIERRIKSLEHTRDVDAQMVFLGFAATIVLSATSGWWWPLIEPAIRMGLHDWIVGP